MTEGDLAKPMLRLAWPLVVIQLLQVAYNVADTFWLGRLSAVAVGAMSIAFPLIFFVISVGGGFTAAGSILVAQYTGAGGQEEAGRVAGQTLAFVGLLSVALGVIGFLVTGPLLGLLPAGEATATEVIPLAAAYMRVFFLGMPFLFGFFIFVSLMRGYGDTKAPMRIMLVSVAVNVVLDPILIFGWGWAPALGIEGAALATIISRGVATVLGLYVLFRTHAGPPVRASHLDLDLDVVKQITKIGVPTALEQSGASLAMVIMTAMVSSFPPAVVAAYGLGNRLSSLVFLPAMGMGQATNTVVGQNLGAEKPERADRAVTFAGKLVAGVMLALAVVAATAPEPIVAVFLPAETPGAAETIGHAADYLRIMSVMFVFLGVFQVLLGAFRGAGSTKTALAFSMVALWLVRLPATYVLAFVQDWGATGLWVAVALGDIVGCIAAALWFARGTWKQTVIERPGTVPESHD